MPEQRVLTAKGRRQAEAVLDATIRCLGEHGYAGTSLQRVADEASLQKRMVLYYFGSRERLIAAALDRLAQDFLDDLDARTQAVTEPGALVDAVLDTVLANLSDRRVLAAYFGLVAESTTDPALHAALDDIRERGTALAHAVLDRLEAAGRTLSMERGLLILAATSAAHGLGLELVHHGMTPELERAIAMVRLGAPLLLFE